MHWLFNSLSRTKKERSYQAENCQQELRP
ncbi:gas vesicle protein GvpC [Hymenobacter jejuensis]|uniref:Gas vesicle protein C n=1 Tax=Hymenobacter jejuensis TaxID=2502781 RepID=A0A5B8A7Q2_9BACT|nr:gas vesicle protein GvpC [Hymenobacter jejuensis]